LVENNPEKTVLCGSQFNKLIPQTAQNGDLGNLAILYGLKRKIRKRPGVSCCRQSSADTEHRKQDA
jgi:hypothetical protein